ncbi:MAG: cysteine desulfurase NifS [Parcubacteria group bacterium CG10_big_fil_rev_8_21_14_0_10_36_14]|nr:MAG: cysteine desulfurase NifS [Parcubacteria group bacterium CG10_big_fil_rev_8_21_14_0_10_36_14]
MKNIYLDNAATTKVRDDVLTEILPFFNDKFGNPSSFHGSGKVAKDSIESAREKIAKILNCRIGEIIFTGGGTESDNLAILGTARANKGKGGHIITLKIEHPAVLEACKELEKEGFEITYLPVGKDGIIKLDELKKALRKDTILVSIMYANNEIGTIQPIKEIAKIIRDNTKKKETSFPYFHTDACQAAGALDLDIQKLGVDMLTLNGSKIYGPKGVGTLFVKKSIKLQPLIFGGGQESGLRGGTESVPSIVGLAKALELAQAEKEKESVRLIKLRDYFIKELLGQIRGAELNGDIKFRLPNNINISIPRVEGEAMVLYLDSKGIYCSTGSACSSSSLKPSHVLLAIGRSHEMAHNSLRFTLGRDTKKSDLDYVIAVLPEIVKKLTEISSL